MKRLKKNQLILLLLLCFSILKPDNLFSRERIIDTLMIMIDAEGINVVCSNMTGHLSFHKGKFFDIIKENGHNIIRLKQHNKIRGNLYNGNRTSPSYFQMQSYDFKVKSYDVLILNGLKFTEKQLIRKLFKYKNSKGDLKILPTFMNVKINNSTVELKKIQLTKFLIIQILSNGKINSTQTPLSKIEILRYSGALSFLIKGNINDFFSKKSNHVKLSKVLNTTKRIEYFLEKQTEGPPKQLLIILETSMENEKDAKQLSSRLQKIGYPCVIQTNGN